MQSDKPWSQFDGSIGDPIVRSMIAVFTSGTSIAALNDPQISDNIVKAATYTLHLGVDPPLPRLAEAFPGRLIPAPDVLSRGKAVYMGQCSRCHGQPDSSGWKMPPVAQQPPITALMVIGTDPSRLDFRYSEMLPTALATTLPLREISPQHDALDAQAKQAMATGQLAAADWWVRAADRLKLLAREFPAGHSRAFPLSQIAKRDGYLNAPIPFAWLRAPYLHNGSVLTLRALIGLDERLPRFCRGSNPYDPDAIGLIAVAPDGDRCPAETPFLFDVAQPGNSNAGHMFPPAGSVDRADLEALLVYLGTL
jgi:hypothetical protein